MTVRSHLLYSAAAVRRLLHLSSQVPVEIRVFAAVVWVWVEGQRPQFWSKQTFRQHFRGWRKQQARSVIVRQVNSHQFVAWTRGKDETYLLKTKANGVSCTCEDFHQQFTLWGKGCCKHGYAVLKKLGFSPLHDYVVAQMPAVA